MKTVPVTIGSRYFLTGWISQTVRRIYSRSIGIHLKTWLASLTMQSSVYSRATTAISGLAPKRDLICSMRRRDRSTGYLPIQAYLTSLPGTPFWRLHAVQKVITGSEPGPAD